MPNALLSTLLVIAVAVWWRLRQADAPPITTICPGCGHPIRHLPGLLFVCPDCGRWRLG